MLVFIAGRAGAADDGPVSVRMDFSPRKITVGDRVKFTVLIEAPAGVVLAPPPASTVFGEWEVLDFSIQPEKKAGTGRTRREFGWILTAWTTGKLPLPVIRLTHTGMGGKPVTVSSPPGVVEVESVLARDKNPSDLRPPKGLVAYRNIWPYVRAALAVLAVSFLLWWWQRRRKRLAAMAAGLLPGVPVRPPEEIAREALAELSSSGLAESGEVKLFYIRLSDILRRYIEGKFGISALDRTTAELMPEVRRHHSLRELFPEIRAFFEDCDLAKFAKYVPSAEDITADLARARRVVDVTAPLAGVQAGQGVVS